MTKLLFSIISGVLVSLPVAAQDLGAAPLGDPGVVATQVLVNAKHPCPKIKAAQRNSDGTISALCTNNEDYRLFSLDGKPIAMRCSVIREMGIGGC
jgi:hypothetical protein